jgi:enamine deaminase RidA (YjgF/YER057c/UK114 family)
MCTTPIKLNPVILKISYTELTQDVISPRAFSRRNLEFSSSCTDADGHPIHAGDIAAQIGQALDNLEQVLHASGYTLANVVRLNYYTTDVDQMLANWAVLAERLSTGGCRCTSTLLGVTRLAYPEMMIEIEATAMK